MVISFIGLASNLSVIIVISHKKNEKELKEQKHFHYMRINAIFNALIFIIQIFELLNDCLASRINYFVHQFTD